MKAETPNRIERLKRAFQDIPRPLILTHDNPDPDALGSAFALGHLLSELADARPQIGFGGTIGRAENRAMVRLLDLDPAPVSTLDLQQYGGICLVDAQPGTGNSALPESLPLVGVIDHHPLVFDSEDVAFAWIEESAGATATLVLEAVRQANVTLPTRLATALFYALKSETQDLGREAAAADRRAYLELLPVADMRTVARIQRARVPREYFQAYGVAIQGALVYRRLVLTDLGIVASPDIVAEIADFLLRLQGVDWACCLGRHGHNLAVSLRTSDPEAHAGGIIRTVMAGLGSAGGHGTMAGGQMRIRGDEYSRAAETITDRLLRHLGQSDVRPEPLVPVES